ncbi:MAG: hypothetical protein K2L57_07265, partial [Muribaculaceae bacterium]|nr:hypothetical protein [Muribaculaceae bacterium]
MTQIIALAVIRTVKRGLELAGTPRAVALPCGGAPEPEMCPSACLFQKCALRRASFGTSCFAAAAKRPARRAMESAPASPMSASSSLRLNESNGSPILPHPAGATVGLSCPHPVRSDAAPAVSVTAVMPIIAYRYI